MHNKRISDYQNCIFQQRIKARVNDAKSKSLYESKKREFNKLEAPIKRNASEKWKRNKFKDFCLFKHIFINI